MKKITLCLMLILALIIVPGAIFAADGDEVAKIGEIYYTSLQSAIDSITNSTQTTITLVRSVEDGAGFKIPSGRNIIIDFGGYTYNVAKEPVGSAGTETCGCQLLKDSNITFKNGTLTATCVQPQDKAYKSVKILIQNYSNLTLENMTIDATQGPDMVYGVSINNGEVAISGDTEIKANSGVSAVEVCWWPSAYPNGTQVTIDTTGTITGDIEYGAYSYEGFDEVKTDLTIENVNHNGKIVFNSDATEELVEKEILVNGGTFSSDVTEYAPVAKIGDKTYTTLPKALADVPTDGTQKTIVLLKDVVDGPGFVVNKGQNVIIDFGGHSYDASNPTVGSNGTKTNGCQLLAGSKVTMKDGTLTSTTSKILIQNYSDLILENMTIDAVRSNAAYALSNNNGETNITGNTTIQSNNVAFDLCWWPKGYPNGAQVTVNTTGKIIGDIELGTWGEVNEEQKENVKSTLTIENIVHEGNIVSTEDYLNEQLEITGGTFSSDVKEYISSELNTWENQDGTVEVVKERKIEMYVVAENGDVQFGLGAYLRDGYTVGRVGEKVYLSVEPEKDYEVVLTIKDAEGKDITYGKDYSFVMPDSDVSIKAEFIEKLVTPPAGDGNEGTVTPPAGDGNEGTVTPPAGDGNEGTVTPPAGEGEEGTVTPPADNDNTGNEDNTGNTTVTPPAEGDNADTSNNDKKEEDVPQTGDNVVVYAVLAVVAMAGIAVTIKMRKK